MKISKQILKVFLFLATGCGVCATLLAQQGVRDTSVFNNNGAGIPNSGNTLRPNNGPEFPHSSPANPTTDPGPLTPGTNGNTVDTVPHYKIEWHKQ